MKNIDQHMLTALKRTGAPSQHYIIEDECGLVEAEPTPKPNQENTPQGDTSFPYGYNATSEPVVMPAPPLQPKPIVELLAEELHRNYRAAEKALNKEAKTVWRAGVQVTNTNRLLHDHGWASCGKQAYFRKRAAELIRRSQIAHPETLSEAESALAATVLIRRLSVYGKLKLQPLFQKGQARWFGGLGPGHSFMFPSLLPSGVGVSIP